jgi:hypothetical protein
LPAARAEPALLVGYESEKAAWTTNFPRGEPLKDGLADLVERDSDPAEQAYYEAAADPQFVKLEAERRRYLGQLRRRLRRRR